MAEKAASDILQEYALNWGNCWLGKQPYNTDAGAKVSAAASGENDQAA